MIVTGWGSGGLGRQPQRGAGRSPAKKILVIFIENKAKQHPKWKPNLALWTLGVDPFAVSTVRLSCSLLLLMVRNYKKKGGHGGSRGGGLATGFWEEQGGREAAAIAKAARKAKAAADKKSAVERASEQWRAMVGGSKAAQNGHSEQPASELRCSPRKAAAASSSAESATAGQ